MSANPLKTGQLPAPLVWRRLDEAGRRQALSRPAASSSPELAAAVANIIEQVREAGDAALLALTERFDGVILDSIRPQAPAAQASSQDLQEAIDQAAARIEAFHLAGKPAPWALETAPGMHCEVQWRPLQRVGLYVPGGSAPLISTLLMLGIPARLAGCREIIVCTPPGPDGRIPQDLLFTAGRIGVTHMLPLGGAQAIAAMGVGTESIARCDKLFGPGNAWVTAAKQQLAASPGGPAIDLPAGPSEVLVVADQWANPDLVALDLLSQAEHDSDAQALLVTDSAALAEAVQGKVLQHSAGLSRQQILAQSLQSLRLLVVENMEQAIELANDYAPEHLIIQARNARDWLPQVQNAGAVFLGPWTPESLGDYCSGSNHVLPTGGHARAHSGLCVADFMKRISVQQASAAGLGAIGPCAARLAAAEGLDAHRLAVTVRLEQLAAADQGDITPP